MFIDKVLGQEALKKNLFSSIEMGHVPHCQCFIGDFGQGGLSLAIAFALDILWKEEILEESAYEKKNRASFLEHPDLHFVYPITGYSTTKKIKSTDYIESWRRFALETPYANPSEWILSIGSENKQGSISTYEINELYRSLHLKSLSGGPKVCILWDANKLNNAEGKSANKLLKLIEEPPPNTYFILVAENENDLLSTIKSRCQLSWLSPLDSSIIENELIKQGCEKELASFYASNSEGSLGLALKSYHKINNQKKYEELLVQCLRHAHRVKRNKSVIIDLMQWADLIGSLERTIQKEFLLFAISLVRQALLFSYKVDSLFRFHSLTGFKIEKLAPYIHSKNALELFKLLEDTCYAIDRNANGKILFSDFALQITRIINRSEN